MVTAQSITQFFDTKDTHGFRIFKNLSHYLIKGIFIEKHRSLQTTYPSKFLRCHSMTWQWDYVVKVETCRQSKDADSKFAQEKDAKGNLQPTIYNHVCL